MRGWHPGRSRSRLPWRPHASTPWMMKPTSWTKPKRAQRRLLECWRPSPRGSSPKSSSRRQPAWRPPLLSPSEPKSRTSQHWTSTKRRPARLPAGAATLRDVRLRAAVVAPPRVNERAVAGAAARGALVTLLALVVTVRAAAALRAAVAAEATGRAAPDAPPDRRAGVATLVWALPLAAPPPRTGAAVAVRVFFAAR